MSVDLEGDDQPITKSRSIGRKLWNLFLVLLFFALVGGVLFLLSERNARMYYAVPNGDTLTIMRGKFLPQGEEAFRPDTSRLVDIYAPIPIPEWASRPTKSSYVERVELDVGLANTLLGWAQSLVETGTSEAAEECVRYLARARAFPAITPEQRKTLADLERDVAYYQARGMLESAASSLRAAAERLKVASTSTGENATKSLLLMPSVEAHIDALEGTLGQRPPPPDPEPEPEAESEPEPEAEPEPEPEPTATSTTAP